MKMVKFSIPIVLFTVCLFMTSCQKDRTDEEIVSHSYYGAEAYAMMSEYLNIPESPMEYKLDFPDYYNTDFTLYDKDLATLGRVLFYDKNLSEDRTISCASCHKQEIAFSDDVAFSRGIAENETARNSLALGSVFSFSEYYGAESFGRIPFFWDNRAISVAEQATGSFGNPLEMGMEMDEVAARVNEKEVYYKPLFAAAYGKSASLDEEGNFKVSEEDILEAISEFVNSMGSFDSKFDQGLSMKASSGGGNITSLAQEDFPNYTTIENVGKAIYQNDCAGCHSAVVSAPSRTRSNNGLAVSYVDNGIGKMTGAAQDMGMFKVPTLRNIALTAPYMHDGSLATLEEVIEHYSTGIANHPNLDFGLQPGGFGYSQADKDALLAFLKTTSDEVYTTAVKYSDPFKQ